MNESRVDFRPLLALAKLSLVMAVCALIWLLTGGGPKIVVTPAPLVNKASSRTSEKKLDDDRVVDGIHVATGLVYAEGFEVVRATCTACHSARLVTQNRATRDGWRQMIRWMQATQGLWDLGRQEDPILDYLAAHYAPEKVGRRANLDVAAVEWYILELEE